MRLPILPLPFFVFSIQHPKIGFRFQGSYVLD